MYSAQIIVQMRNFIFIFLSFIAFIGRAQNNVPQESTNSNTNTIAVPSSQQSDTVQSKEELDLEIKAISTQDKYRSSKKVSEKNVSESAKDEMSEAESSAVMSSSFSLTKQQAATQRTQRSPNAIQQEQMNNVVLQLEENSPESFEFHYFKYVAGNYNVDLVDHLKKAEVLRPANSDVQIQLAAYYLIMKDSKNALIYLDKIIASTRLSKDVIDYAEDLIQSAPENGTLITHGFDDSFATAYVQLSKKIRSDVKLISLDFLQSEKYQQVLKSEGFNLPSRTIIDVAYFQDFCFKNTLKNLSISMTVPKEYLTGIQQNLFVVGLGFEYHTDLTFNNFYKNDYLWNEVLTKKLIENSTNEKAKALSSNYLPMILHLRKVYFETGEKQKVIEIDKSLDKVAVQCKKYDQVQKLKSSY